MAASTLVSEQGLAGVLMMLAFISFAIGASLPLVGEKGNMQIWGLPVREYLSAVADNGVVWRWANVFMGAAAVILMAGLTVLTTILEGAGERVLDDAVGHAVDRVASCRRLRLIERPVGVGQRAGGIMLLRQRA